MTDRRTRRKHSSSPRPRNQPAHEKRTLRKKDPLERICAAFCWRCSEAESQGNITQLSPRPSVMLDYYLEHNCGHHRSDRHREMNNENHDSMRVTRMAEAARKEWKQLERERSIVSLNKLKLEEKLSALKADHERSISARMCDGQRDLKRSQLEKEMRTYDVEKRKEIALRRMRRKEEEMEGRVNRRELMMGNRYTSQFDELMDDRGKFEDKKHMAGNKELRDYASARTERPSSMKKNRAKTRVVKIQVIEKKCVQLRETDSQKNRIGKREVDQTAGCQETTNLMTQKEKEFIDMMMEDEKFKAQLEELREQQRKADEEEKRLKELEEEKARNYEELYKKACEEQAARLEEKNRKVTGGTCEYKKDGNVDSDRSGVVNSGGDRCGLGDGNAARNRAGREIMTQIQSLGDKLKNNELEAVNMCRVETEKLAGVIKKVGDFSHSVSEGKVRSVFTHAKETGHPDVKDYEVTKCRPSLEKGNERKDIDCDEKRQSKRDFRANILKEIKISIARLNEQEMRRVADNDNELFHVDLDSRRETTGVNSASGERDDSGGDFKTKLLTNLDEGDGVSDGTRGDELKSLIKKSLNAELEEMLAATMKRIRGLENSTNNENEETERGNDKICSGVGAGMMRSRNVAKSDHNSIASSEADNCCRRTSCLQPSRYCKSEHGLNCRASKLLQGGNFCDVKRCKVKMREVIREYSDVGEMELRRIESDVDVRRSTPRRYSSWETFGTGNHLETCRQVREENGKADIEMQSKLLSKDEISECMKDVFRKYDLERSRDATVSDQMFQTKLEEILDQQYKLKLQLEECFLKSDVENMRNIAKGNDELWRLRSKLSRGRTEIVEFEDFENGNSEKLERDEMNLEKKKFDTKTLRGSEKRRELNVDPDICLNLNSKLPKVIHHPQSTKTMRRARFYCRLNKRFLNDRVTKMFSKRKIQRSHPNSASNGNVEDEANTDTSIPGTELDLKTFQQMDQKDMVELERISQQQDFNYYGENYQEVVHDLMSLHSRLRSEINVKCFGQDELASCGTDEDDVVVICNNVSQNCNNHYSKLLTETIKEPVIAENKIDHEPICVAAEENFCEEIMLTEEIDSQEIVDPQIVVESEELHCDLEENLQVDSQKSHVDIDSQIVDESKSLHCDPAEKLEVDSQKLQDVSDPQTVPEDENSQKLQDVNSHIEQRVESKVGKDDELNNHLLFDTELKSIQEIIEEADQIKGPKLKHIFNVESDQDALKILCGGDNGGKRYDLGKYHQAKYPEQNDAATNIWDILSSSMASYANDCGIDAEITALWPTPPERDVQIDGSDEHGPKLEDVDHSKSTSKPNTAQFWSKEEEKTFDDFLLATKPHPGIWEQVSEVIPSKSREHCINRFVDRMFHLEEMRRQSLNNEQDGINNLTILLHEVILNKILSSLV